MHPSVIELVTRLLAETKSILGHQFVGLYLHGSLAWGDFDPERSDVDFLVVTAEPLQAQLIDALKAMHDRIAFSDLAWRTNYEGSYIPEKALRRHDPADATHPAIDVYGTFRLDNHDSTWVIQRHILRERGITVAGPPAASLIDPVTADDLRQATRDSLAGWWAQNVENPFRLTQSDWQAFAVLTMCRALYTLEHGTVASKPQAAVWARERLGGSWSGLINAALAWRHGERIDRFAETHELMHRTVALARDWPQPVEIPALTPDSERV